MLARRRRLACFLTLAGLLAACASGPVPIDSTSGARRPVDFYTASQPAGTLTVRLFDDRARGVQTLADADAAYNGIRMVLTNAALLKAPRIVAMAKQTGVYAAVFTDLPPDPSGRYLLTVNLYRNVATPTNSADVGYATADNQVGQGSATFALTGGVSTTVDVTINAVGALVLKSGTTVLDPTSLTSGQTDVVLDTQVNTAKDPEADSLLVSVLNTSNVAVSTRSLPVAQWPASPATATASLTVPTLASGATAVNYKIVADLLKGSTLLSRRSQAITVSAVPTPTPSPTASPSPSPSPTPSPAPTATPTPTPSPTATSTGHSYSCVDDDGDGYDDNTGNPCH